MEKEPRESLHSACLGKAITTEAMLPTSSPLLHSSGCSPGAGVHRCLLRGSLQATARPFSGELTARL